MRVIWLIQIVVAGFQELEAHERRLAADIAQRVYHDRTLTPNDRQHLLRLARKAGRGAARGARRRAMPRGGDAKQ
jgi:hypothetical protein